MKRESRKKGERYNEGRRGRGGSVLKRVRGPKITENSWKSAHVGEGGREKEEDRSNEADSLFSVFSASGGIGWLSGAFFFSFSFFSFLFFRPSSFFVPLGVLFHRHLPPPYSPNGSPRRAAPLSESLFLPFEFPSRGIMRPSCRELLRLVTPFSCCSRDLGILRKTSSPDTGYLSACLC